MTMNIEKVLEHVMAFLKVYKTFTLNSAGRKQFAGVRFADLKFCAEITWR